MQRIDQAESAQPSAPRGVLAPSPAGHWRPLKPGNFGWLGSISDAILRREITSTDHFPYLGGAQTLLVASDYAGTRSSPYRVYAFLTTVVESLAPWRASIAQLRASQLPERRRMSFKRLGDGHRAEALVPFLDAANRIPGVLLLVAFSKSVGDLLDEPSDRYLFSKISHWKPAVREELFRVLCLVSLLVAGLSRPGHDVLWLSDEDAIVSNSARMQEMAPAFMQIASSVVPHQMGNLRFATTGQDSGDLDREDLAAIPDLAAGALLNFLQHEHALTSDTLALDERAGPIMWWLANGTRPPACVLLLDRDKNHKLNIRTIGFRAEQR
ncbi:MAG TPA: hypothetical protein VGM90_18020 [Kofleriaceae bacterium]